MGGALGLGSDCWSFKLSMSGSALTNQDSLQFEHLTVRPLAPMAPSLTEYRVEQFGQVSII